MCGNATLTIVVSTTCMTVASMTEMVIMPRFSGAAEVAAVALAAVVALIGVSVAFGERRTARQQRAHPLGRRPLVARVDVDDGAHARAQLGIVVAHVDGDANRDTLRDLDPVARRVLRRNHRELGARRLADAVDAP